MALRFHSCKCYTIFANREEQSGVKNIDRLRSIFTKLE